MEALYIIAALAGIWGAFLKTLEHFHLTLPGFGKLLARQPWGKIFGRVYIGIAIVISLILIISLVSIAYARPFTTNKWLSTIIFVDIALLGIWGIWVPVPRSKGNKKLSTTMSIIGAPLLAVLFACYWIYQWPAWQTPALLTALMALMIIAVLIFVFIEKRRRKVKA